jgi:hypothetical protein
MLKQTPHRAKNGNKPNKRTNRNGTGNGKRPPRVRELPKITIHSDTRDILAHAAKQKRHDYFIVDVDAHVTETAFWSEVIDSMDSDVYRQTARAFKDHGGSPPGVARVPPSGSVRPHSAPAEACGEGAGRTNPCPGNAGATRHGFAGINYMVVFPTPMLV